MSDISNSSNPAHIIIYGTVWCGDCKRSKKFLGEQRVHYDWVDIEENAEAMAFVEKVNDGKHIVPTILFPDGTALVEPSNADLAKKLGIESKARMSYYDLIIVGGGPAGLTVPASLMPSLEASGADSEAGRAETQPRL